MFFRNQYMFMSNMSTSPMVVNSIKYCCLESAFQSFKTTNKTERIKFSKLDGYAARKLGRIVELRADWHQVRLPLMKLLVRLKFKQNPLLIQKLITVQGPISEENTWNDTFWGISRGIGKNHLGIILENERNYYKENNPLK